MPQAFFIILSEVATVLATYIVTTKWHKKKLDEEEWRYVGQSDTIKVQKGKPRKIQVKEQSSFGLQTDKTTKKIRIQDVKVVCEPTDDPKCGGCTKGVVADKGVSLIAVVVENENDGEPTIVCLDDDKPIWPNSSVYFHLRTVTNMRNENDRAFIEITLKN